MLSITNINNFNVNFTSGLSQKILARGLILSTDNLEKMALKEKNIDAKFNNNKPLALCFANVWQIFDLLKNKTNSNLFLMKFPRYRVFNRDNLVLKNNAETFCIPESCLVLNNEPPFETSSIFQQKIGSLKSLDEHLDADFRQGKRSSGHFLSEIIHEIMHSIYINHIYNKYGYDGICPYTKSLYPTQTGSGLKVMEELQHKTFSSRENEVLKNVLGDYSTQPRNQYHEVFAETFTKLICDSLAGIRPVANPLESLKNYPKEFLDILFKVLQI